MKYAIGIDVGGTTVKYGLFQENGKCVDRHAHPTAADAGYERLIDELAEEIPALYKKHQLNPNQIIGVGIGLPGPVINDSTISVGVNISLEKELNMGKVLTKRINLPVIVANDANVAALGEQWQGAGSKHNSLVLFTLGTGVGGGVVIDGKIISGTNGSGGELGHMPILEEPSQRTCGCGSKSCLELMCSATGIKAQVRELLEASDEPSTLRNYNGHYDARAVFSAARNGDKLSMEIVETTSYYLGKACAVIAAVVDPELFVIGGGVSNAGDLLLEPTRAHYQNMVFSPMKDTPIIKAQLGNNAGIYGAAKLALDRNKAKKKQS